MLVEAATLKVGRGIAFARLVRGTRSYFPLSFLTTARFTDLTANITTDLSVDLNFYSFVNHGDITANSG